MASHCTQIPTMICPTRSLSQLHSSVTRLKIGLFISGPQTCHARSFLNITTSPPGTLWFGAPWRHFSCSPWPKLLHAFPSRNCFLYYYVIIYWFPCSLLVFPVWSMSFKREGNFPFLFTSVCPVPVHNRQWEETYIIPIILFHDCVSRSV